MSEAYLFFFSTPFRTGRIIRALTGRKYNHVGLSLSLDDPFVYSYARYRYKTPWDAGFQKETFGRYAKTPEKVYLRICRIPLMEGQLERIKDKLADYEAHKNIAKYNFDDILLYPFGEYAVKPYQHTCAGFVRHLLERYDLDTIGQMEMAFPDVVFEGMLAEFRPDIEVDTDFFGL